MAAELAEDEAMQVDLDAQYAQQLAAEIDLEEMYAQELEEQQDGNQELDDAEYIEADPNELVNEVEVESEKFPAVQDLAANLKRYLPVKILLLVDSLK
jgi:hypothetical protein